MATSLPIKPVLTAPPTEAPHKRGQNPVEFDALMQPFVNWVCSKWFPDATATLNYMGVAIDLASTASADAATANEAAVAAVAAFAGMRTIYLGDRNTPPDKGLDGGALVKGSMYLNSTAGAWYWWDGSTWVLGISNPGAATVPWANITGKPTTVEASGITNAVKLADFTWANLANKPSTLAGYNIGDALKSVDFTWAKLGGKPTTLSAAGLTNGVTIDTTQEIAAVKGFTAGVASRKGIGIGNSASTDAYLGRRCLQFSTDISFPNVKYTDHPAILAYATMPGEWGSGSLTFAVATNFGVYNTASPCFVISDTSIIHKGDVTGFSDGRLKFDWQQLPVNFIELLADVKHGIYTRKDTGVRQAGVLAQDMQKVLQEVVHTADDEMGTLSVAYGNAALVACVQLAQRVLQQEERIKALEAKL